MNFQLFTKTSFLALFLVLLLMFVLLGSVDNTVTNLVCDPERTQGLIAPAPQEDYELIALEGPGVFLSASITKQGGRNDLTFVILDIDGRNVVNISISAAKNVGLTQNNPYILNLVKSIGDTKTLTIGFPYPLYFERELYLGVHVREAGVVQILANVIHGK
ncbi:MAG: hypothetical protein ACYS17_12485 [Planctomycetota bacterium]|jgi:hypothetical protein